MASWVRNLLILTVVGVWSTYILTSLARGQEIDLKMWGVPGVIYAALNPGWKKRESDEAPLPSQRRKGRRSGGS